MSLRDGRFLVTAAPRRQLPRCALVVEARGTSWSERQMQQQRCTPQLPKIEDDGNPRFVMFIRTANVYFWYPLNVMTGGTTVKIMLASKDNFLGKYIYKDTLARNLVAVIYKLLKKDELKTVVDKVKDFFGEVTTGAKESLAQITGFALTRMQSKQKGKKRNSTQRDERSGSQSRASTKG